MGLLYWLRRLLGLPTGAVPCNLCRRMIPPDDFDRGTAVMVARRQYCRGCVAEITGRSKQAGSAGDWKLAGDPGSSSSVVIP